MSEHKCDKEKVIDILVDNIRQSHTDLSIIRKDVKYILQEVSVLKFKSGVWGLLGGAIPAALIYFSRYLAP